LLKLYDNVTDRQTDGRSGVYLLPSLAEFTGGKSYRITHVAQVNFILKKTIRKKKLDCGMK